MAMRFCMGLHSEHITSWKAPGAPTHVSLQRLGLKYVERQGTLCCAYLSCLKALHRASLHTLAAAEPPCRALLPEVKTAVCDSLCNGLLICPYMHLRVVFRFDWLQALTSLTGLSAADIDILIA